jgi:hypothetical protein
MADSRRSRFVFPEWNVNGRLEVKLLKISDERSVGHLDSRLRFRFQIRPRSISQALKTCQDNLRLARSSLFVKPSIISQNSQILFVKVSFG